jgi:hypothetical protein
VTPRVANAIRVGGTRTQEQATRTDLDNGLLVFFPGRMSGIVNPGSGVASVGGNQVLPFEQRQTRTIVGDDLVWGAKGHSIKFGVEYERQSNVRQPAAVRRRVVVVSEPHGIPAEPAIALPRSAPRSDRRGAKHQGMASHELRPG